MGRQRPDRIHLPSPYNEEYSNGLDPTLTFFYHPRTITVLVGMLMMFLYIALFASGDDTISNVKWGLAAAIVVFILFGVTQFPNGPYIRPHPAVWRGVLAISVVYYLFLVFLLFQNVSDARQFFTYLDSSLGIPLPEKSYGDNCELSWDNIWNQFVLFVIAHSLGWFGKAIILRDYWFCWILSIMFEVMEYSLQHHLPNFNECWWDHWILDVLVCNWLGTYIGMKTCEYLEFRHYCWRGISDIETYKGKMKRAVQQFTPHSFTKFQWGATDKFKNFAAVLIVLFFFLQVELNAFYLKFLLWIPADHTLNVYRLCLYFVFGSPGVREVYQFLTDSDCKRLGPQAWILIACIITETLICVKFGKDAFQEPTPDHIIYFWVAFISAIVLYAVFKFLIPEMRRRWHRHKMVQHIKNQ